MDTLMDTLNHFEATGVGEIAPRFEVKITYLDGYSLVLPFETEIDLLRYCRVMQRFEDRGYIRGWHAWANEGHVRVPLKFREDTS